MSECMHIIRDKWATYSNNTTTLVQYFILFTFKRHSIKLSLLSVLHCTKGINVGGIYIYYPPPAKNGMQLQSLTSRHSALAWTRIALNVISENSVLGILHENKRKSAIFETREGRVNPKPHIRCPKSGLKLPLDKKLRIVVKCDKWDMKVLNLAGRSVKTDSHGENNETAMQVYK